MTPCDVEGSSADAFLKHPDHPGRVRSATATRTRSRSTPCAWTEVAPATATSWCAAVRASTAARSLGALNGDTRLDPSVVAVRRTVAGETSDYWVLRFTGLRVHQVRVLGSVQETRFTWESATASYDGGAEVPLTGPGQTRARGAAGLPDREPGGPADRRRLRQLAGAARRLDPRWSRGRDRGPRRLPRRAPRVQPVRSRRSCSTPASTSPRPACSSASGRGLSSPARSRSPSGAPWPGRPADFFEALAVRRHLDRRDRAADRRRRRRAGDHAGADSGDGDRRREDVDRDVSRLVTRRG